MIFLAASTVVFGKKKMRQKYNYAAKRKREGSCHFPVSLVFDYAFYL
jgi:hypothetical protein